MPTRTQTSSQQTSTLARQVAPEDIARGDFVALLNETYEFPSYCWGCDSVLGDPSEVVRIKFRAVDAGWPVKVVDVCLPFVFCITPQAVSRVFDVRQHDLARLNRRYAKRVWRAMTERKKKRRK